MTTVEKIEQWVIDRNLQTQDPRVQFCKVIEELGELCEGIKEKDENKIKDGIGDVFVTLICLNMQLNAGVKVNECVNFAIINYYDRSLSFIDKYFIVNEINIHIGKLAQSILKNKYENHKININMVIDWITYLCLNLGLQVDDCLNFAYNEIKDRKGKLVNGTFVKEIDL